MTKRELTRRVIKRIKDKDNWTKHVYAVDADGFTVHPWETRAAAWCATGAALLEVGWEAAQTWNRWVKERTGHSVVVTNDTKGHDEVLRLLRSVAR